MILYHLGCFEFAQLFKAMVLEFLFSNLATWFKGYAGHDFLTVGVIRDSHSRCIKDRRVFIKDLIDFSWSNVFLPPFYNEFLDPA